jgi:hypothetical protein
MSIFLSAASFSPLVPHCSLRPMSGEEHILEKFRLLLFALKKTQLSILSVF